MKRIMIMATVAAVAACSAPPAMLDMSQDRVIVMGNNSGQPAVRAEAARGCGLYNRTPVFMSQSCVGEYCLQKRYLFACRALGAGTSSLGVGAGLTSLR